MPPDHLPAIQILLRASRSPFQPHCPAGPLPRWGHSFFPF